MVRRLRLAFSLGFILIIAGCAHTVPEAPQALDTPNEPASPLSDSDLQPLSLATEAAIDEPPNISAQAGEIGRATRDTVNVRSSPKRTAKKVGELHKGDRVKILESRGDWVRIGTNRWVLSTLIKRNP